MLNWLKNLISKSSSPAEVAAQLTLSDRRIAKMPGLPSTLVYDQMELDSMVQTALQVKKLGVLAAPAELVPANDSVRAARILEFVQRAFERMEGSVEQVLYAAMDAFAKGWSVQELVFSTDADGVWLDAVRPKNASLFGLNMDSFGRLDGLHLQFPGEPEQDLPREKFVIYRYRTSPAMPKGRSDLEAARTHWQAKRGLIEGWRVHLERFASPTMLGRFDRTVSADETDSLFRSLSQLANSGAMVFPKEFEVSAIGGDTTASTGFIDAIDFHNREIARCILGQTLTTDEGRRVGSLALGKVHLQVMLLQMASLRKELADAVVTEQVIRPLVELNFGPGDVPRYRFSETQLDAFALGAL